LGDWPSEAGCQDGSQAIHPTDALPFGVRACGSHVLAALISLLQISQPESCRRAVELHVGRVEAGDGRGELAGGATVVALEGAGPSAQQRGQRIGYNDWNSARPVDYRSHHLRQPPRGYEWRQSGSQYVLAAVATGVIASIILDGGR